MLIIKITACEKSMEKPGQVGQQNNYHVHVCVWKREKREERESWGMRFMGHMMVLGCDGAKKSELFAIFYIYYWFNSDYKSFLIALLPLDHFYSNFIFKINFTDF